MSDVKISQFPYIGNTGYTPTDLLVFVNYLNPTGTTNNTKIDDVKNYVILDSYNYFLPLSGGTVTGSTTFTNGLTTNTISATTYQNLPQDIFVTGGTYTNGEILFKNNSGGSFTVTGLPIGGAGGEVYYLNLSQSQSPYQEFSPIGTNLTEQTTGVTINSGVTSTIASFLTPTGYPNTIKIPAGVWSFYLHSYKDVVNASFDVFCEVYVYTTGGTETLVLTTAPAEVLTDSPTTSMELTDGYYSGSTIDITDRILVKVRTTNTGSQTNTITFFTEGQQNYSYGITPFSNFNVLTCETLSGCTTIFNLENNKVNKSGDTMTGTLYVPTISATTILGTSLDISGNTSSDLVKITQTGSGNAFVVEDSSRPDSTPFRIDASGNTAIGVTTSPLSFKLEVNGTSMFRNNMSLNQALFSEFYTYNSFTDLNKVNLNVNRFHDHNDGPVDIGYTAQLGWHKRQSSNISLARSIDIPVNFTSGSTGTVGQFNSINTFLQIQETSTITTPFVAHSVSATKGTTGTVTSFTGFDVQDNSVSNTTYGFRSRLTSGSGKYGLYFDGTANNYLNGNVGIGTISASEKLDVSGKTKTINLQVTSGATSGYVLTSDTSGNATWQIPTTFTGGTVNGLTATTLSANTVIISGITVNPKQTIVLFFGHDSLNPGDTQTYYIGNAINLTAPISGSDGRRVIIPKTGNIIRVDICQNVGGTIATGSTEYSTFTINNVTQSTQSTITTTYLYNTSNGNIAYDLGTPLSVNVDDKIEIRWTTPAWGVNPTAVRQQMNVYLEY